MPKTASREIRLAPRPQGLSVYLRALGMTGMTAWAGLHLVEVRAGETIFISGAARRGGECGRPTSEIARVPRHRVSRFHGEGHVSA